MISDQSAKFLNASIEPNAIGAYIDGFVNSFIAMIAYDAARLEIDIASNNRVSDEIEMRQSGFCEHEG